jgi:hypothetical protein
MLITVSFACTVQDDVGQDAPSLTGGTGAGATAGSSATGGNPSAGSGGVSGTGLAAASGSTMSDGGSGSGGAGGMSPVSGEDGGFMDGAVQSGPQDPECDARGVWIARLTTFSRDSIFSAVQTASNWYYYAISQSGADFTISSAMDCGLQTSGSADVTINQATTEALLKRNDQAQRHGTFYKEGDHCVFTLDRFYSTRGVPRAPYLPADTSSNPELSSLDPLPTLESPAGSEDWDEDGSPGIAFNVAGLGSRHVVQRDWNEGFSDEEYPVALGASELLVRARFDNQENILATTGGLGGLLMATATPATDLKHRMLLRRVGSSEEDPAVVALHGADDVSTCFNVQDAMPHDRATQ